MSSNVFEDFNSVEDWESDWDSFSFSVCVPAVSSTWAAVHEYRRNTREHTSSVQEEDSLNRIRRWPSVVDTRQSSYDENGIPLGQK